MAISFVLRKSNQLPRNREIGSFVFSSACAATPPRHTIAFGAITSSCRYRIRRARRDLVVLGLAIFRRAALHDVADVDVFALQAHRFDHLREQFPGAPDKRQSLNVFIVSRAFADKHEFGARIPCAEDNLVSLLVQPAARAFAQIFPDELERIAFDAVENFKQGRGAPRPEGWGQLRRPSPAATAIVVACDGGNAADLAATCA